MSKTTDGPRDPFDYSEAEWGRIQDAVTTKLLSPIERESLVLAGRKYRVSLKKWESSQYLTANKRAKSWANVVRLIDRLLEALETAARNRTGDHWREEPLAALSKELTQTIVGKILAAPLEDSYVAAYRGILSVGDGFELLAAFREGAAELTHPFLWSISKLSSWSGRWDPQLLYYQHVLWLWTDIFGGTLKISRHPVKGTVTGPLERYFFSVVNPVMGKRAPRLQSLPDIVKRQKSFDSWLDGYLQKSATDRKSLARQRLLSDGSGDPL